ncbi:MAG: tRNA adenosine(34) deaminase TadA [Clostridia bacterium]|nr:tRNA adenosine(34) deaminase TadA [Clostridia bacterium]
MMDFYMNKALEQAKKALSRDEVPIGAVIVKDGVIIARGYNKRESSQNALAHAEIIAISKACKKLKSWRLDGAEIYVTLEPCPMCAGAIMNARISKIVFGAYEPKSGACGSKFDVIGDSGLNHNAVFIGGVMEEECSLLIKNYFKSKRG